MANDEEKTNGARGRPGREPAGNGDALFLFAHASGSSHRYGEAFGELGKFARLEPLELPGHGKRRGEKALDDLGPIVADLTDLAEKSLGRDKSAPYRVFGHSMGTLVAYLTVNALLERGYRGIKRFFASSNSVPGWHPIPRGMTELPDEEMWLESAKRFGVLNNQPIPPPEQMKIYSDVYRADLRAVMKHKPTETPKLPCPVTVFYAEKDMIDRELAEAWKDFGSMEVEILKVPGGHFHPVENPGIVEKLIIERL
jgi:surfactin synthase thioesterase subunit